MKNLIYFFSILFMFIGMSCNKEKQISNYEHLNCLKGPSNEQPDYDSVSFIKLETNPDCLITEFKQMEMNDSLIFLLDTNNSLFIFNREGKFVTKIGRKGDGPGEYINLSTFYIDNKNEKIVIIDDFKSLLISYDFTGHFLSSIHVPLGNIRRSRQALLSDKNILLLYNMMNMEDNMAYSVVDPNTGHLKGKYFTYNPITVNYLYPFSEHPMVKYENEIHFIMLLSDTIYNYSKSSFSIKYIVDIAQKWAQKKQIDSKASIISEIFRLGRDGYFTGFTTLFETKSKIFLDYKEQGSVLGYFLFDKQTKEGNQYLYTYDIPIKKVPLIRIVYSLYNQFVGIANPDYLLEMKDKLDVNNPSIRKFKEMLDSTKEDDNPILFFYEFK